MGVRLAGWITALAAAVLLPSVGQVQKYLGLFGVVLYLCCGTAVIVLGSRRIRAGLLSTVTERRACWLAVITFLGLILIYALVYPFANSGIFGGGSDRDEALNIATTELLHGRYPYYPRTYLGNPVHNPPGSILLAVPFVLLGNSAYQNIFWLAIFFIVARSYLKDTRLALLLLWAVFILSPVVLQEVVTGGDLLANGLYPLVFALLLVSLAPKWSIASWKGLTAAGFLGVGLSSRANFVLLLPLVFSALVQNSGWRNAVKYLAVTCATFGAITLPFYLYDPNHFTPLLTPNKFTQFGRILPHAKIIMPAVSALFAVGVAVWRRKSAGVALMGDCAIVQAFPVFSAVILSSLRAGRPNFRMADYGLSFLFFGALASWAGLAQKLGATTPKPDRATSSDIGTGTFPRSIP